MPQTTPEVITELSLQNTELRNLLCANFDFHLTIRALLGLDPTCDEGDVLRAIERKSLMSERERKLMVEIATLQETNQRLSEQNNFLRATLQRKYKQHA